MALFMRLWEVFVGVAGSHGASRSGFFHFVQAVSVAVKGCARGAFFFKFRVVFGRKLSKGNSQPYMRANPNGMPVGLRMG